MVTNNGMAQLKASGLQKGELLKLLPALPLRYLPPTLDIGGRGIQTVGILLFKLSSSALLHKLALNKHDLLDKSFGILMSRG
jgi:hypothetical protein